MRTLENGLLEPGHYARSWDGTTTGGSPARAGVYFVHLTALAAELSRKVLLLR